MPNFKLECEHRKAWDQTLAVRNTSEFYYETLDEILPAIEDFLRGSGFVFEGHLDIIQEEVAVSTEPLCGICKLPQSVMEQHHCYDKHCPKIDNGC